MIMSVSELKKFIITDQSDEVLEAKLQALEILVRKHTNNNFQVKNIRFKCQITAQKLYLTTPLLQVGDTIQISQSDYNNGVYTINEMNGDFITLNESLYDEYEVVVSKVAYPKDIKMGIINMIKWDIDNRDKVGIASETISRHSVSYFNMDGDNSTLGYPKSIVGFLKPYIKARF